MAQQTRTLAGVTLLNTPLIQAALEYARTHNDPMSFNHVYRSWVFGSLLASKIPPLSQINLEVHAVSAILHDLAWDHASVFSTPDKRFEVDSANAAREFLASQAQGQQPHLDDRQVQLVWDSIALHTTPSIAQHKEPEVALCTMGITADFMGPSFPGGLITREEYDAVVRELPLLDFKDSVKNLMCGLCWHKPETTYDNFVREFGVRFVEGYSVDGKTAIDFLMRPID